MNSNQPRLAIFDIDGTLTHTAAIADRVFVQTVAEFLHVLCDDIEWPDSTHGTDSGVLHHILGHHGIQPLTPVALAALQRIYLTALRVELAQASPIPGAADVLRLLSISTDWSLAFATGNWLEPALHKLTVCGLSTHGAVIASSSDSHDRTDILRLAVSRAGSPCPAVYLGDRPWDKAAAERLGIGFVAVGGGVAAEYSLDNYEDHAHFWNVLEAAARLPGAQLQL